MHDWDAATDLLAQSIMGATVERLRTGKDRHWGARPAEELAAALLDSISADGIGGHEALRRFREVILPACRPMDDPRNLAYVPTAPTPAATMFDLLVSASSIMGAYWETGAGAIAAENQALRWLADLAGFPDTAGGCFVSGGSAANLSALAAARHRYRALHPELADRRLTFLASEEVHSSVSAAARVLDAMVVPVRTNHRGAMTAEALDSALAAHLNTPDAAPPFAVAASAGTTNSGAIDELAGIAEVCEHHGLWFHVDGAYGGAAMCAPSVRARFAGIERADSFGIDPHKWLFAPYDSAALVYRDREPALAAHAQHAAYLDEIDRNEANPADLAFHLSRRARGLPLWFSLATYGTDAYAEAVEATLALTRRFVEMLDEQPDSFELLTEPDLSVVLFRRRGWQPDRYRDWSERSAREGFALLRPTSWRGETCLRVCIVHPNTTEDDLAAILEDLAAG